LPSSGFSAPGLWVDEITIKVVSCEYTAALRIKMIMIMITTVNHDNHNGNDNNNNIVMNIAITL